MKPVQKFTLGGLWALISLMISASILLGIFYAYMYLKLPSVAGLKDIRLAEPLRVFTQDGKLIAEYGETKRNPVALSDVPKPLINAILATEDRRFYDHPGIDFIGLVRAAVSFISTGEKSQGASTITMQVARNFYLTRKKTFDRKIKEILLALKIDHTLSKDKILELYVNKVYFGRRAYGVAAAAHTYYGKPLNQLTLPEMALIAGLPRSPSRDNPIRNPQKAIDRRNHVLYRMYEDRMIDKATYHAAIKAPLTAHYHPVRPEVNAPYVGEMVRQAMVDEFGKMAYIKGFDVYTTIDSKLQDTANSSLNNGLIAYDHRHGYRKPKQNLGKPTQENLEKWPKQLDEIPTIQGLAPAAVIQSSHLAITALVKGGQKITIPPAGFAWAHGALPSSGDVIRVKQITTEKGKKYWSLMQIPKIQGALVSINSDNGAILALKGGFSFHESSYNRATQSERQPGSAFKPFVYSAGLSKGYTLASVINDSPIVLGTYGGYGFWRPKNYTKKFYGPTRLRRALMKSQNIVSVKLMMGIGVHHALHYITRFGFNRQQLPASPSLALGVGVTTPLQMAVAYSVFANGGYKVSPYFISQVFENNKLIYKANPPTVCEKHCTDTKMNMAPRIITADNAYMITNVLRTVIEGGTGRRALALGRKDIAGKTGTTNDNVDAWFAGFNRDITTVAWLGFDTPRDTKEQGAHAALPIWINFMKTALKGKPERFLTEPPNIVYARIDPYSGKLASPGNKNAIIEMFEENSVPKTRSNHSLDALLAGHTDYDEERAHKDKVPHHSENTEFYDDEDAAVELF